jgi:hypothetical protein
MPLRLFGVKPWRGDSTALWALTIEAVCSFKVTCGCPTGPQHGDRLRLAPLPPGRGLPTLHRPRGQRRGRLPGQRDQRGLRRRLGVLPATPIGQCLEYLQRPRVPSGAHGEQADRLITAKGLDADPAAGERFVPALRNARPHAAAHSPG